MKDAVATMGMILPDDAGGRDAVHVAVFSAKSRQKLFPGQDVSIMSKENTDTIVSNNGNFIGIVDPFLKSAVPAGERFWVYLYPRTITSLSHKWGHPAFEQEEAHYVPPATKIYSEQWMKNFILTSDCPDYDTLMEAVSQVADGNSGSSWDDEYLFFEGSNAHGEIPPEFWEHAANILGREIKGPKAKYFTCSC